MATESEIARRKIELNRFAREKNPRTGI